MRIGGRERLAEEAAEPLEHVQGRGLGYNSPPSSASTRASRLMPGRLKRISSSRRETMRRSIVNNVQRLKNDVTSGSGNNKDQLLIQNVPFLPQPLTLTTSLIMIEISNTNLTSLSSIFSLNSLRLAILSHNEISGVEPQVKDLTCLEILDLSYNKIADQDSVTALCEVNSLICLNLSSNAVPDASYRGVFINQLSKLRALDGFCISDPELLCYKFGKSEYMNSFKKKSSFFSGWRIGGPLVNFQNCSKAFPSVSALIAAKRKFFLKFANTMSAARFLQVSIKRMYYQRKYSRLGPHVIKLQGIVRGYLYRRKLLQELQRILSTDDSLSSKQKKRQYLGLILPNMVLSVEDEISCRIIVKRALVRAIRTKKLIHHVSTIVRFFRNVNFKIKAFQRKFEHFIAIQPGIFCNYSYFPVICQSMSESPWNFFRNLSLLFLEDSNFQSHFTSLTNPSSRVISWYSPFYKRAEGINSNSLRGSSVVSDFLAVIVTSLFVC